MPPAVNRPKEAEWQQKSSTRTLTVLPPQAPCHVSGHFLGWPCPCPPPAAKIFAFPCPVTLWAHILSRLRSGADTVPCQTGLKPCWTRDGQFLCKCDCSSLPCVPRLPAPLVAMAEDSSRVNTEWDHISGMHQPSPKGFTRIHNWRIIILFWCYEILNSKFNVTRNTTCHKHFALHAGQDLHLCSSPTKHCNNLSDSRAHQYSGVAWWMMWSLE